MKKTLLIAVSATLALSASQAMAKPVGITKGVMEMAGVTRTQDNAATIDPAYAKTSRPCPPFCIQPMHPFSPARVDTIGEIEVLKALEEIKAGNDNIMLMDSRTTGWYKRGTRVQT